MNGETPRFVSGRKAAEIIGCSRETVRRLAAAGTIKPAAVDANGNNLYDPEALAVFAKSWTDGRRWESKYPEYRREIDAQISGETPPAAVELEVAP